MSMMVKRMTYLKQTDLIFIKIEHWSYKTNPTTFKIYPIKQKLVPIMELSMGNYV